MPPRWQSPRGIITVIRAIRDHPGTNPPSLPTFLIPALPHQTRNKNKSTKLTTLFLTSLVDPVHPVKDAETPNCSEVDRAYTDTTDGAPAFNTLPGPLAPKHAVKSSEKLSDAYSTTA